MILALAVVAGALLVTAAMRQGFRNMASAIEQVGQALAGAHSAAYDQLKADIEAHVAKAAEDAKTIADLTAKLAAAGALVGTPDVDLLALDALLNPAPAGSAPLPGTATETPVTTPENPPPAPAVA